jgi:4-amino-4-deoxy-L-arabinose transferase-like glycosyltransferase
MKSLLSLTNTPKSLFLSLLAITFFIKLIIAYQIPMIGDETEYVYWAQHLRFGYYDHPPLIAWLLHPFAAISTASTWLRLPQMLVTTLLGIAIYSTLSHFDKEKAYLTASLYLISPLNIIDIFILTDTPLILFSFLAISQMVRAEHRQKIRYYFLAGLCMGAAFLSKYLMFPLLASVFFFLILTPKITNRPLKLILFSLGFLPFFAENVIWNYYHNWVNFLFNTQLRNTDAGFSFHTILTYLLQLIYLFSPFVVYQLIKTFKDKAHLLRLIKIEPSLRIILIASFLPLIFYFALSFFKSIGLHWIFCMYAIFFMALFVILSESTLKKLCLWMGLYSLLHVVLIALLLSLPLSIWQNQKFYGQLALLFHYPAIAAKVKNYHDEGFNIATPDYTKSYMIVYRDNLPVSVWGYSSVHGRGDDLFTDFRQFDGKNIVIVYIVEKDFRDATNYKPYFKRIETAEYELKGMKYYIVLGYQFNYPLYRAHYLKAVYQQYYQDKSVPLLPPAHDDFGQKYGFQ